MLLEDNEPCKTVGKGKVQINLNNGSEWMLKDVRHIPAMKRNLISIGTLYLCPHNTDYSICLSST